MIRNSSDVQKTSRKLLELFNSNETNPVKKSKTIIKFLKKNNVPLLIQLEEENTLLHLAVIWDLPQLAEHLLTACPELLSFRNQHHASPISLVRELRNFPLLALFKKVIFPISTPPPASKDELAQLTQQFSELKIFKPSSGNKPKSKSAFVKVNEIIQKYDNLIDSLESDLEELLLDAGFEYQEDNPVDWTDNLVWDLSASLTKVDDRVYRKPFDKKYTTEMVQAILSIKPATEILQDIIDLWVAFDKGSKLTAIFMVKELIIRDPNQQLLSDEHNAILKGFFDKIKSDFPSRSTIMLRLLNNLIKTRTNLFSHPDYLKYLKHCNRARSAERTAGNVSFERLLLETSERKGKEQKPDIALIAREFDALTLSFFHNVTLSEYYGCAWQRDQREVTSPNITTQTEALNQLNSFIQNFILQARTEQEFAARFSLFIRVASRLAQGHDGVPPNFDAVILIMLSIDSFNIVRAKSCLELLSSDDKKRLKELRQMVDPIGGFRKYRELVKASTFALINSGRFQTDVTLAYENTDHQYKLEMLGTTFVNFLEFQKKVRSVPFRFRTDLLHLLSSEQHIMNETHQLCLSGKFAPVNLDALTPAMFEELLNTIVVHKILPHMRYDQIDYPPKGIIIPVVAKLKEIADSETELESKKSLLSNAKELMIELTQLINEQYDLAQPVPRLSPIIPKRSNSIEVEQQPMLLLSKKLSDIRRNQSFNTISVPSDIKARKRLSTIT